MFRFIFFIALLSSAALSIAEEATQSALVDSSAPPAVIEKPKHILTIFDSQNFCYATRQDKTSELSDFLSTLAEFISGQPEKMLARGFKRTLANHCDAIPGQSLPLLVKKRKDFRINLVIAPQAMAPKKIRAYKKKILGRTSFYDSYNKIMIRRNDKQNDLVELFYNKGSLTAPNFSKIAEYIDKD